MHGPSKLGGAFVEFLSAVISQCILSDLTVKKHPCKQV